MYLLPATANIIPHSAFSYVRGDKDVPLMERTLGEHFDSANAAYGERDALIVKHQSVRWSYTQLSERVTALAAGLVRLGLQPGERLGIWSQNCAEWVLTQYA